MTMLCEIRGGKGCQKLQVCGLRDANQRCRNYIEGAATVSVDEPLLPVPPVPATPTPAVEVTVTTPVVQVGVKL